MMWLEARKQEKKIRGMLVDYKRRAERRKDYYEKIRADPTQFIQVHGRPCKIHLDPAVAVAGDSPANMMSWQGNTDILIDRFDVRAHLDYIPEIRHLQEEDEEPTQEERLINYERYRILAQNEFLGVSEDKFLHQLMIEEQFGPVEKTEPQPIEGKKKVVGAAIGFNYAEGTSTAGVGAGEPDKQGSDEDSQDEEDDDDSDIDFDLCVDVNKVSSAQAHELNGAAHGYGMMSNDFFSFLTRDVEEAENIKIAREREEEKAMFSGRKSRRERRAFREKRLLDRKLSPPSYAAGKDDPIADLIRIPTKSKSRSRTRSPSPPNAGMIQYITSFGGEEPPSEPPPPPPISASVHRSKEASDTYKRTVRYKSSRSPENRARRSESQERPRNYGRGSSNGRKSRSSSPVHKRYKSRSRSRSRSPVRSSYRGRSSSYERNRGFRRKPSRSNSRSVSPTVRIVRKRSATPQPVRSVEVPAPPVITRYYGRHKNESSSSDLDLSDSEDKDSTSTTKTVTLNKRSDPVGNAGGRSKPGLSSSKVSVQELLKKKRQALINRQYKADKKAERLRQEKAEQERQDREEEMRELSIKMRKRERQKRHQYYETGSNPDSDDESRLSNVSSAEGSGSDTEHRSRAKGSQSSRDVEPDRYRRSPERERSRGRETRRESDDRKDRRGRDDRDRDRSRDRQRNRSRDRDRSYRDRERGRDRSRDRRERHSRERDYHSPSVQGKRPFRPLVDY